jgi:hypothetical protein
MCPAGSTASAPQVGYESVLRGLVHLGLIEMPGLPEAPPPRLVLEIREPVLALQEGDRLLRRFRAAEPVQQGQIIGRRQTGEAILAPEDGAVIFAGTTARPGTELCFLCRRSLRFS